MRDDPPFHAAMPVYKAGIVLLREGAGSVEGLFTQVRPKQAGEAASLALPRGSRQYCDAQGHWRDARDDETARAYATRLEPLSATLIREAEEEAGVPPSLFDETPVYALGTRLFTSRSGTKHFPIAWAVMPLSAAQQARLNPSPADALAVRWLSLAQAEALAAAAQMNACYPPLLAEAITGWQGARLARWEK